MSEYLGMDPHQVQQLGHQLLRDAEWLEDLRSRLTGELFYSTWEGRDAEEARSEWASSHAPALGLTAELLRRMSSTAFTNAQDQIETARADIGIDMRFVIPWPSLNLLFNFNMLDFVTDFVDFVLDVKGLLPPYLVAMRGGNLALNVLGVFLDFKDFSEYLSLGDTGGVILGGAAVVLGGAAVIVGIIALAPLEIAVATGLAVAAVALGVAASVVSLVSESAAAREWVGDRWDDVYQFTGGLVEGVTEGVRAGFDSAVEATGQVIEGAADFASDAVGAGRAAFDAIF